MFWDSSDGIEEYTTSVTGFINKCIEEVVPTMTVRTYPKKAKRQYKIESYYTCSDARGRACKLLQTTKESTAES